VEPWLSYFAVGFPLLGAILGTICGIARIQVGNRIVDIQSANAKILASQVGDANDRAKVLAGQVSEANERARAANESLGYLDVAMLNFLGLHGTVLPPLEEHTELNNLLAPHVQADPFTWRCNPQALAAYDTAIGVNAKFPFAYYYRGTCRNSTQTKRMAGRH
jgi:hypothetical protein